MPSSFVLGSSKSSTYPRGYASGFDSPAALLDDILSLLRDYSSRVCHNNLFEVGEGMGHQ